MDQQARTAVINARVAITLVEMEAMKAANAEREVIGDMPEYSHAEFMALRERAGIDENAVVMFLRD